MKFYPTNRVSASKLNDIERRLDRLEHLFVESPLELVEDETSVGIRVFPQAFKYVQVTGDPVMQEDPPDWLLPVREVDQSGLLMGDVIWLKASVQRSDWLESGYTLDDGSWWDYLVPALDIFDRFFIVDHHGEWVVIAPFEYD